MIIAEPEERDFEKPELQSEVHAVKEFRIENILVGNLRTQLDGCQIGNIRCSLKRDVVRCAELKLHR